MLVAEQYFIIYLLAVFLLKNKSVKLLSVFLTLNVILDNILYYFLQYTPQEFLIIKLFVEVFMLLVILQFIECFKLRNLFILCFVPTLICPLFLLSIDHWITRNDFISYMLFYVCMNVTKYSNELFLTYVIYTNNDKAIKTNFWQVFVACNYIAIFIKIVQENQ